MLKMFKSEKVDSTNLSDFVQNSSSAYRKQVYKEVVRKATESQKKMLRDASAMAV